MSNPQMASTPPDDIVPKIFGAIITALLGAVAWLWRKAFKEPRQQAHYYNGERLSKQDYISQLETDIDRLREATRDLLERSGPRLASLETSVALAAEGAARERQQGDEALRTLQSFFQKHRQQMEDARNDHDEKIRAIEDELTLIAQERREQRMTAHAIQSAQKSMETTLASISAQLARLEKRLPA